mgnify:CR=1 FL=1
MRDGTHACKVKSKLINLFLYYLGTLRMQYHRLLRFFFVNFEFNFMLILRFQNDAVTIIAKLLNDANFISDYHFSFETF